MTEEITISADEISKLVLAHREEIVKNVVEGLVKSSVNSMEWTISNQIRVLLEEQIKIIIAEEMATILKQYRQQIQNAIVTTFSQVGAQLSETLIKQATKNLTSYNFEDITKKLFAR